MNLYASTDVNDLACLTLTENRFATNGAWQVYIGDKYSQFVLAAYVSADDARTIAARWTQLADQLDTRTGVMAHNPFHPAVTPQEEP
jgi:hypothetical protein